MQKKTKESLPKTVLFTHYGDNWIRGSERCLLDLIKHLDKNRFKAILWCNQAVMAKQAEALNIKVYCSDFPLLFGWKAPRFNVIGFFQLIKKALKIIEDHDIKIIHANSAAPCQWLTFASQKSNVPLICHMHSTYQLRDRLSLGLYQVQMVIGVSEYVVAPLINDKKSKDEISIIANGIDTERLLKQKVVNLRTQLKIEKDDFVLACLGSLIHRKGIDLLIDAVAILLEKGISAHLLVIGDGSEYLNLTKQIERLSLQSNVHLLGERDEAVGILRGSADLFVSAAREEAFGLVFAEASLAGLAIVAPKTGGIPNVVIDQKSGLLIPTEDVNALVIAINKLYRDPQLRQSMARAGAQHISNHFTIEKNSLQFQNLYEQQIDKRQTRKPRPWLYFTLSIIKYSFSAIKNKYLNKRSVPKNIKKQQLIVVDPTAFSGGSKVATESILQLIDTQKFKVTVLTADKDSWQSRNIKRVNLYEPQWLAQKEQGVTYFIRHAFIALNLLVIRLRFGSFHVALGASGPGVDLALYMLKPLIKIDIIQLIHGPVAQSRTIAKCLKNAYQVHYLHSSYDSLQATLSTLSPTTSTLPSHFHPLLNGLSEEAWPTYCQTTNKPTIYWAASLLKWKGLDILLTALEEMDINVRPQTHICFIRPRGVQLPVTNAPITVKNVDWHENPSNIDQIRASANIFVSTSRNEPFGLSILEAMAAGLCIVIPADGAYWDNILQHDINCIKYIPDDADDLKSKLLMLSKKLAMVIQLGEKAAEVAQDYRAKKQYKNVVSTIEERLKKKPSKISSPRK